MEWRYGAACATAPDPDVFFPVNEHHPRARYQMMIAKRLCAECQVRESCRDWAVQTQQNAGIWGGLTPAERRSLGRARRGRRAGHPPRPRVKFT